VGAKKIRGIISVTTFNSVVDKHTKKGKKTNTTEREPKSNNMQLDDQQANSMCPGVRGTGKKLVLREN
jgi:hypothetical protein